MVKCRVAAVCNSIMLTSTLFIFLVYLIKQLFTLFHTLWLLVCAVSEMVSLSLYVCSVSYSNCILPNFSEYLTTHSTPAPAALYSIVGLWLQALSPHMVP